MATKTWSAIRGRKLRATEVSTAGVPRYGLCKKVITKGFIVANMTSEITEGEAISVTLADGTACINEPGEDQLRWIATEIQFCEVDPDLLVMFNPALKKLLNYKGDTVGIAESYSVVSDRGIGLEIWQDAAGEGDDDPYAEGSWVYWLLGYLVGGTIGDIEIGNTAVTFTVRSRTRRGSGWGRGPYDVQLNPPTLPGRPPKPGPLLEPVTADEPRRVLLVEVAPPPHAPGCQPLSAPTGPVAVFNEDDDGTGLRRRVSVAVVASSGSYRVDWGDGSAPQELAANQVLQHSYAAEGQYHIAVWDVSDAQKVTVRTVNLPFVGTISPEVRVREDTTDLDRRSVTVTVDNHGNGPVGIDWGDGTPVTPNVGDGVAQSVHAFPVADRYVVTVTDNSDASSRALVPLRVPFGIRRPVVTVLDDHASIGHKGVIVRVDNGTYGQVIIDWGDATAPTLNAGDGVDESRHTYTFPEATSDVTITAANPTDSTASTTVEQTLPWVPVMVVTEPGPVRQISVTVDNDAEGVTIDWGDNTATSANAGDGLAATLHTFADAGTYIVKATDTDDATRYHQVSVTVGA